MDQVAIGLPSANSPFDPPPRDERRAANRAPRTSRPAMPARARAPARYAARARSGDPYCAAGNAMRAVSTPCVSKPIGSCWRLIALRTSSAAPGEHDHHERRLRADQQLPHPRLERSAERALAVAEILGQRRAPRRLPRRQQADEHRAAEHQRHRRRRAPVRSASRFRDAARRRARAGSAPAAPTTRSPGRRCRRARRAPGSRSAPAGRCGRGRRRSRRGSPARASAPRAARAAGWRRCRTRSAAPGRPRRAGSSSRSR